MLLWKDLMDIHERRAMELVDNLEILRKHNV